MEYRNKTKKHTSKTLPIFILVKGRGTSYYVLCCIIDTLDLEFTYKNSSNAISCDI